MAISFDGRAVTAEFLRKVREETQPDKALALLKTIAETPGPSQTVSYSRGLAIAQFVREMGGDQLSVELDLMGTGNVALRFAPTPRVVFLAHADEISYLVGGAELPPVCPEDEFAMPLIPFCNHNAQLEWSGTAHRYDPQLHRLRQVAEGVIRTGHHRGQQQAWFSWEGHGLEPGDRVIYHTPTLLDDSGLVRGKVDNALGIASLLLAASALQRAGRRPPVWFLFTDEEEGPPQANASFARSMRRLVHATSLPAETLFVEIDAHEVPHDVTPAPAARFAEKAKFGHGVVTPPDIYVPFRQFARALEEHGIAVTENTGYVSRSDSVAVMEKYRNVLLCGYEARDTHYRHGWPTASLRGLVALAQLVACISVAAEPSTHP